MPVDTPGLPPPPPRDEALGARVARIVTSAYTRSRMARQTRRTLNTRNWDALNLKQDWSHKAVGQSKLMLPDLPLAVEQICAQLEQNLTTFADWFQLDGLDTPLLDPVAAQKLLARVVQTLYTPEGGPGAYATIQTVIADAVKMGLAESVIVLKVYGVDAERPVYQLETTEAPGPEYADPVRRVTQRQRKTFQLAVELVPFEDHYPDVSPARQYDIHEVTRKLHELRANPDYDRSVVEALIASTINETTDARRRREGIADGTTTDPTQVRVREFWGDLVDDQTGELVAANVLVTMCQGKILRWGPEGKPWVPNPCWHGQRPFIQAPLIRTPLSPVHKALLDHAVPMAEAQNELMSLMLDGGLKAVHGVSQVHPELIDNADELAKGIPPGFVGIARRNVPPGQKFYERVDDYTPPTYGDLMLNRTQQALQAALAASDIAVGRLPPRQVKATEIVESMEASQTLYTNLAARIEETIVQPLLLLGWWTTWQHLDDFAQPELVQILGPERAALLMKLTAEERFVLFANGVTFTARGLRNTQSRMKEFQKDITLLNLVNGSPALAQVFEEKYSMLRLLEDAMRAINKDPTTLERRENDPVMDVSLLVPPGAQGAANQQTPLASEVSSMEQAYAPANPDGYRGAQEMQ